MKQAELDRFATGELIWELVYRRGVTAVSAGDDGLCVRTAGPALALIVSGMSLNDEKKE